MKEYINLLYTKRGAKDYDFFGSDSREELHWGKIFLHLYGEFHSKFSYRLQLDSKELLKEYCKKYRVPSNRILKINRKRKLNQSGNEIDDPEYMLIADDSLMVIVHDEGVLIYYGSKVRESTLNDLKVTAEKHWIKNEKKSFNMITQSANTFELSEFKLKSNNIDLNLNYNDDLIEIDQLINQALSKEERNGIILLHGIPGTGKTSYIRHLIGCNPQKQFIYLPNYLISSLNSPEFLPFIINYKNSVLILEDCENSLLQRDGRSLDIISLSTLLNLGDGLLGDALSMQVIATFNAHISKIDDALLRKGRLIARYEFKELEPYKAQRLAESLKKNVIIDQPMILADVYNIETISFENQKMRKVGFCVG